MSGLLQNTRLGDYELIERIGEGGMADVYRAKQLTAFGREVALKVIRPDYTGDEPFRRRFLREARAISRLSHPNILPLIEFGRENGALFLVMPLVREGTLRDLLDTHRGPLTLEEALPFFLPLCDAVQYAHQEDIIHRDIKPQNILLQRHTHVLLADFGIARDLYDTRVTTVGAGIGSVEYMAPEQAEGRADVRSDIYSLGIVLYQLLTGVVPYSGTIPLEVLFKKAHEPLPNPLSYNPGLPADVVDILQIALSKDPGQRFEAAAALSNAAQQLSPCGMPPRLSRQISGLPGLDAPAAPDIDFASTIHARPRPPAPAVQEAWATRSFGSLPTELFSNAPATSQPLARRQNWPSDPESQTSPTRLSEEDEPPWGYRRDGVPPGSGSNPPSNHKYALLIAALIAALILTIGISSIAYGHLGLSWLHPDTANTGAQLLTPAPGITPRPTQPSGPPVTQPAPPSGPASTPTPQPTATPTPVPTDTPTPQPTATPAPTETPAPAPTDTPAPQPTVTPPPAPTQAPAPPSDNAPAPGANPAATP